MILMGIFSTLVLIVSFSLPTDPGVFCIRQFFEIPVQSSLGFYMFLGILPALEQVLVILPPKEC